ncbi:MAG: ATP-binding protein [Verrucomicrobiia bacterium]
MLALGNEALLTQCVSNLLANAVKFVEPGCRPRVRLWTEQRQGRVALFVRDNGIGIDRDKLDRIWRLFERVHQRQFPGTGMGLSIVKRAAEKMGGSVGVQSEPGKGSTFRIELNRAGIGLLALCTQSGQASRFPHPVVGNLPQGAERLGTR